MVFWVVQLPKKPCSAARRNRTPRNDIFRIFRGRGVPSWISPLTVIINFPTAYDCNAIRFRGSYAVRIYNKSVNVHSNNRVLREKTSARHYNPISGPSSLEPLLYGIIILPKYICIVSEEPREYAKATRITKKEKSRSVVEAFRRKPFTDYDRYIYIHTHTCVCIAYDVNQKRRKPSDGLT